MSICQILASRPRLLYDRICSTAACSVSPAEIQNFPQMPTMKTVLVVDSDVGFVFWLGQGLDQNRYAVLPAANVPNARTLLDELRITADLVVVNPALPDAANFVEALRGRNPCLKVVLV